MNMIEGIGNFFNFIVSPHTCLLNRRTSATRCALRDAAEAESARQLARLSSPWTMCTSSLDSRVRAGHTRASSPRHGIPSPPSLHSLHTRFGRPTTELNKTPRDTPCPTHPPHRHTHTQHSTVSVLTTHAYAALAASSHDAHKITSNLNPDARCAWRVG